MGEAQGSVGGRRCDGDSPRGWFGSREGRWHGSGFDDLEDAGLKLAPGLGAGEGDGSVGALGLVPDPVDVVAFFEENADFLGLSKQGPLCPQVNG